jgi:thiamine-phosphate pyrophosphorylase
MTVFPRLYAIADSSYGEPVRLAASLFEGGARLLQVRNKTASSRELLMQVEAILKIAPPESRVIVNDRSDIALVGKAAGVHLGQQDIPAGMAREILGSSALIGVSTHNLDQALAADNEPIDYIAVGPIFPTKSKDNPDPVIGLENLQLICSRVQKPVVALGGVTLDRAQEVFDCGASSIAVINDILRSSNVADRTRDWLH